MLLWCYLNRGEWISLISWRRATATLWTRTQSHTTLTRSTTGRWRQPTASASSHADFTSRMMSGKMWSLQWCSTVLISRWTQRSSSDSRRTRSSHRWRIWRRSARAYVSRSTSTTHEWLSKSLVSSMTPMRSTMAPRWLASARMSHSRRVPPFTRGSIKFPARTHHHGRLPSMISSRIYRANPSSPSSMSHSKCRHYSSRGSRHSLVTRERESRRHS
jgi:hypothetical protein